MEQKKIEQLVKKVMKRDEDALEILLSQYQEYLYRIAYAYYKNEQEALDKLSPDYRKVLILRYFQDMKIKEIGEVMQIPVTVIPKEVFFDGSSLYIGFQLKTQDEEGFGQEVLKTGVEWYNLDYSTIQMDGTWSDGNGEHVFSEALIGEQTEHDTFEGRLKIATEGISESVEEIQLHISFLFWENYNKRAEWDGNENVGGADYHVIKQGDWNLNIPIKMDASQVKTVTVNETNIQGFGIESITVTPYEIKIVPIIPELNSDLLNQVGDHGTSSWSPSFYLRKYLQLRPVVVE